jgi:hypothetical protein
VSKSVPAVPGLVLFVTEISRNSDSMIPRDSPQSALTVYTSIASSNVTYLRFFASAVCPPLGPPP